MTFSATQTALEGVLLVETTRHSDHRGSLMELYRHPVLEPLGIPPLLQTNLSESKSGVLRGLHFQVSPASMGKLVTCLHGRVFDVAVDVRPSSATFGKWLGFELLGLDGRLVWLPPGYAHGFVALAEESLVYYGMSGCYSPEHERTVRWDDPAIGIEWPVSRPILSARDEASSRLAEIEQDLIF